MYKQYFYPDISAVSQLLGDLLFELGKDTDYKITVLSGSLIRTNKDEVTKTPKNEIVKNVFIKKN